MNIYTGHSKILTVGITLHLNTKRNKLKLLITSLLSSKSTHASYINKSTFENTYDTLQELVNSSSVEDDFGTPHAELIFSIDIKLSKNTPNIDLSTFTLNTVKVPVLTDRSTILAEAVHKTQTDILPEDFSAETLLTEEQITSLHEMVQLIQNHIPKKMQEHTFICFSLNNIYTIRVSNSRNNIIRNASGKFVMFRDDDDMSVNIHELLTAIALAEAYKDSDFISIAEANEFFDKSASTQSYNKDYPKEYDLNYPVLYNSQLVHIEVHMLDYKLILDLKSSIIQDLPCLTSYHPTTTINSVDFLLKHNIFFYTTTNGEDTIWRYVIRRYMFEERLDANQIKVLPICTYAIYESAGSSYTETDVPKLASHMITAIIKELEKQFTKIPFMLDLFIHLCFLGKTENVPITQQLFIQNLFYPGTSEKFTIQKYIDEIITHNCNRMMKLRVSSDMYVEVPDYVMREFEKEYEYDNYTIYSFLNFAKYILNRKYMKDENYYIHNAISKVKAIDEILNMKLTKDPFKNNYVPDSKFRAKVESDYITISEMIQDGDTVRDTIQKWNDFYRIINFHKDMIDFKIHRLYVPMLFICLFRNTKLRDVEFVLKKNMKLKKDSVGMGTVETNNTETTSAETGTAETGTAETNNIETGTAETTPVETTPTLTGGTLKSPVLPSIIPIIFLTFILLTIISILVRINIVQSRRKCFNRVYSHNPSNIELLKQLLL